MPGAIEVLERTANEFLSLRKPNLNSIRKKWESEDSLRAATDALINAGYLDTQDRGKSGSDTRLFLTDLGWKAIGQERPLWM